MLQNVHQPLMDPLFGTGQVSYNMFLEPQNQNNELQDTKMLNTSKGWYIWVVYLVVVLCSWITTINHWQKQALVVGLCHIITGGKYWLQEL